MEFADIVKLIVSVLGCVGLFLYAMKTLSDGLQQVAGKRLERYLGMMTRNRVSGILTGACVSALIHSSGATTVMVVGFANAGLFTLEQSISVVMGANIGTTVTAWIVSIFGFSVGMTVMSFFLFAVAIAFQFVRNPKIRNWGDIIVGIGLLLLALNLLQGAIPVADAATGRLEFLKNFGDGGFFYLPVCVAVGILAAFLLQSSTAAMTVTITLAANGWIGLPGACALCMGQNIGTTVTALIASLGGGVNAKRAAVSHMLFNIFGSIVAIVFLGPLLHLIDFFTPGDIFAMGGEELRARMPFLLSLFHTAFNLCNTLILLPFVSQYAEFVRKIVPDRKAADGSDSETAYRIDFNSENSFIAVPEAYFSFLRGEVAKMSGLSLDMIGDFGKMLDGDSSHFQPLVSGERRADEMRDELTKFCVKLIGEPASSVHIGKLTSFIRIVDELESVADSCYALGCDVGKKDEGGFAFDETIGGKLKAYMGIAAEYMSYVHQRINGPFSQKDLLRCLEFEDEMNDERLRLVGLIEKRMEKSPEIKVELTAFDIIRHLEHIGDFCTNIAQTLRRYSDV